MRIQTQLLPGVTPKRVEANGQVTITYEIGSLEGIESRDSNLPSDEISIPEIDYSTGASWQALATEYSRIVDSERNRMRCSRSWKGWSPENRHQLRRQAAIVDYVDREVRYTGIEFGEAAIVPHSLPKRWH